MDVAFKCIQCAEFIKATDQDVGKEGVCPACGAKMLIPQAGSPATPVPPPPPAPTSVPPAAPANRTPTRETSGYAIAGLVCGILSLPGVMCGGFILGIIGIVLSLTARGRILREPGRWDGDGLAVAGLVTSIVGTVFGLLAMLVFGSMMLAAGTAFAALAKTIMAAQPHP